MIADRWAVKAHCAECGFPCRTTACVHYDAGVEYVCDACGADWVELPSDRPDQPIDLCRNCLAVAPGKSLRVVIPEDEDCFGNVLRFTDDICFLVSATADDAGVSTLTRLAPIC